MSIEIQKYLPDNIKDTEFFAYWGSILQRQVDVYHQPNIDAVEQLYKLKHSAFDVDYILRIIGGDSFLQVPTNPTIIQKETFALLFSRLATQKGTEAVFAYLLRVLGIAIQFIGANTVNAMPSLFCVDTALNGCSVLVEIQADGVVMQDTTIDDRILSVLGEGLWVCVDIILQWRKRLNDYYGIPYQNNNIIETDSIGMDACWSYSRFMPGYKCLALPETYKVRLHGEPYAPPDATSFNPTVVNTVLSLGTRMILQSPDLTYWDITPHPVTGMITPTATCYPIVPPQATNLVIPNNVRLGFTDSLGDITRLTSIAPPGGWAVVGEEMPSSPALVSQDMVFPVSLGFSVYLQDNNLQYWKLEITNAGLLTATSVDLSQIASLDCLGSQVSACDLNIIPTNVVLDIGTRLIIQSPDGTYWNVTPNPTTNAINPTAVVTPSEPAQEEHLTIPNDKVFGFEDDHGSITRLLSESPPGGWETAVETPPGSFTAVGDDLVFDNFSGFSPIVQDQLGQYWRLAMTDGGLLIATALMVGSEDADQQGVCWDQVATAESEYLDEDDISLLLNLGNRVLIQSPDLTYWDITPNPTTNTITPQSVADPGSGYSVSDLRVTSRSFLGFKDDHGGSTRLFSLDPPGGWETEVIAPPCVSTLQSTDVVFRFSDGFALYLQDRTGTYWQLSMTNAGLLVATSIGLGFTTNPNVVIAGPSVLRSDYLLLLAAISAQGFCPPAPLPPSSVFILSLGSRVVLQSPDGTYWAIGPAPDPHQLQVVAISPPAGAPQTNNLIILLTDLFGFLDLSGNVVRLRGGTEAIPWELEIVPPPAVYTPIVGDLIFTYVSGKTVILEIDDGSLWRLSVTDSGLLTATAL